MQSDPQPVVRRFWDSVWTRGETEALSEILDPDATQNGEPVDVEAFKRVVEAWRRIFPNFTATIEDLITIEPDRVMTRVTYAGTQVLQWAGLPASDRSFEVIGIDIFRIRDDRIVELWHSTDHYDMAIQLGGKLVPKETE